MPILFAGWANISGTVIKLGAWKTKKSGLG